MSLEEYRLVAAGWFLLIFFLTVFWYFTLRRLAQIFKERFAATRSHEPAPEGVLGLARFLIRGDFRNTGDERMAALCRRLRQLLYGYLGSVGAYIVFLVIFRSRY